MADLSDTIEEAAGKPQSSTTDGTGATSHSLSDLIKADQYLKGVAAAATKSRGLRFTKLIPPGSISDQQSPGTS